MNKTYTPPFLKTPETIFSRNVDLLVALIFPLILATVYYGWRTVILSVTAILTCVLTELLFQFVLHLKLTGNDLSAVVTGLSIALLLPASAPLWLPILGGIFAVAVAAIPFGGLKRTPFHPVAAATVFLIICWPTRFFAYPTLQLGFPLSIFGQLSFTVAESPASILKMGGVPNTPLRDLLLGYAPGPLGAAMVLIVIACFVYLCIRKITSPLVTLSCVVAAGLFAMCFPRTAATGLTAAGYELLSGSLIFVAVFLLADRRTAPKNRLAQILYGFSAGLICMLLRYFGPYEQAACIAVLVANLYSRPLDLWVWGKMRRGAKA